MKPVLLLFVFAVCSSSRNDEPADETDIVDGKHRLENINRMLTESYTEPETSADLLPPSNYTRLYKELLSQLADYNLTKRDLEELVDNRSHYQRVRMFAVELMTDAADQILYNEIRRHFNFKPQNINFDGFTMKEEPLFVNSTTFDCKNVEYFHKKMTEHIHLWRNRQRFLFIFYQEETDVAERFLNKRFPLIRRLFKMRSEELGREALTPSNVDYVVGFLYTVRHDLVKVFKAMISRWVDGNAQDNMKREEQIRSMLKEDKILPFC